MLKQLASKAIEKGLLRSLSNETTLIANETRTTLWNSACKRTFADSTPSTSSAAAAASQANNNPAASSKGLASIPGIVRALGFSGAIPFWAFSPVIAQHLPLDILDPALITQAGTYQVGYGATIISFLGGVHWGLAMTNVGGAFGTKMATQRFAWSVLPQLMAWPTLAMPLQQGAATQAALLALVYAVDKGWAAKGLLPPWYMALRLPLTVLAVGGLVLTVMEGDVNAKEEKTD